MKTLTEDGTVLSWASTLEPQALAQAQLTGAMPFVVRPLALMPDAHLGKGSTVGSVIATQGAIMPAAIGVDIGCGMAAIETNVSSHGLPDNLQGLHDEIRRSVPAGVGAGHQDRTLDVMDVVGWTRHVDGHSTFTPRQVDTARKQYGSLGSGNHFIEVCLDERDRVWIVLHSGSRGIGNQLATHHIKVAQGLMKDYFIELPDPDLAYLVQGTQQFDAYIADMRWAQDYALANRSLMLDAVKNQFERFLGITDTEVARINCHHNFTHLEQHRGRPLWITRKGAISARQGQLGIIPGSMGTRSYITEGLGSEASFHSCSHGAGRRLSRNAARNTLTEESLREAMGDRTWNASEAGELVDEHPLAYKDIDQVMADQADLVRPVHTLHQILNYKGTK